ncbi:hypothetical protein CC79DRAFT_1367124 [Sarocladium strictum]
MEVDAAIGVASLILQGCDFSKRLYSRYRDQQNQLSRLTDGELEKDIADLSKWMDQLRHLPALPNGNNKLPIAQYQQSVLAAFDDLRDVSLATAAAIQNFLSALEDLNPEPGQSRAESWVKAIKSMIRSKKLKQLEDEVDRCRNRAERLSNHLTSAKQDLMLELQANLLDGQDKHLGVSQQIRADISGSGLSA